MSCLRAVVYERAQEEFLADLADFEAALIDSRDASRLFDAFSAIERTVGAAKTPIAGRAAPSGEWEKEGHRSALSWMAEKTGTGISESHGMIDLCRLCHFHHHLKTHLGYRIEGKPGAREWDGPTTQEKPALVSRAGPVVPRPGAGSHGAGAARPQRRPRRQKAPKGGTDDLWFLKRVDLLSANSFGVQPLSRFNSPAGCHPSMTQTDPP